MTVASDHGRDEPVPAFAPILTKLGYLYACTVGLVWGSLWSTGRIQRRNGLLIFTGMPRWTFGRGGACVGCCYLTDDNVSDEILTHEAVHKLQWQRYGLLFPILYALSGFDPLRNRFEIEAGLEEGGYRPRSTKPTAMSPGQSSRR